MKVYIWAVKRAVVVSWEIGIVRLIQLIDSITSQHTKEIHAACYTCTNQLNQRTQSTRMEFLSLSITCTCSVMLVMPKPVWYPGFGITRFVLLFLRFSMCQSCSHWQRNQEKQPNYSEQSYRWQPTCNNSKCQVSQGMFDHSWTHFLGYLVWKPSNIMLCYQLAVPSATNRLALCSLHIHNRE